MWSRQPRETLADALARTPCKLPLMAEQQGEGFAFLSDGTGYVTISEGVSPALHVTTFR